MRKISRLVSRLVKWGEARGLHGLDWYHVGEGVCVLTLNGCSFYYVRDFGPLVADCTLAKHKMLKVLQFRERVDHNNNPINKAVGWTV